MAISSLHFEVEGGQKIIPVNWTEVEIRATFSGNGISGDTDVERFHFANEHADVLIELIENYYGQFVGVPGKLVAKQEDLTYVVWNGYFDQHAEDFRRREGEVFVKFVELESRESLRKLFSGLTYGYLHSQTPIPFNDLKFSVQKRFDGLEFAMALVVIYNLVKAIRDSIKATANIISEIAGIAASGTTGSLGAAILAAAKAIILAAWTAALILITIRVVRDVVASIVPPKGTHKMMTLGNALRAAFAYYGYVLETKITDLDNFSYLPSLRGINSTNLFKAAFDKAPVIKEGIPGSGDYGYFVQDMLLLVADLFNAKYLVQGNTVRLINNEDETLKIESNYILKNSYIQERGYNSSEARQTNLFSFTTDPSDEYTVENYSGLAYEVKTEPKTINDRRYYLVKGLERIDIPLARGHKKPRLTPAEKVIDELIQVADEFASVFGGSLDVDRPQSYIGKLMVSQNNHSVPKLIHNRDITVDSEYFYTKYYGKETFVNGKAQREVYEIVLPMTLSEFKEVAKNPYFVTEKGERGEFTDDLTFVLGQDKVKATVKIEKVYDNTLKEIIYKP